MLANDRERLSALMGLWGTDTGWTIAGRLPEIPDQPMALDGLEKQAIAISLDLAIARHEIESFARELGLVKATAFAKVTTAGFWVMGGDHLHGHLDGPKALYLAKKEGEWEKIKLPEVFNTGWRVITNLEQIGEEVPASC